MTHRIGEVSVQGGECKVLAFPVPRPGCPGADRWAVRHAADETDPDFPGITVLTPYKSRFRRRREALGLAPPPVEPVGDLVMLRPDEVDTSPSEMNPA